AGLHGHVRQALRRGAAHPASARPRLRGPRGGLPGDLADRRAVRSRARQPDRLDGGDRPASRDRSRAPSRHGGQRRRARDRRRRKPRRAAAAGNDRGAPAPALLHRPARAGSPAHDPARLLRRLQPRAARGQARHSGQSAQELPAQEPVRGRAMSDIVNDDDLSALAAEYVLGTLEADERTRANVLLDVDHGFRGLVRVSERRFGELHLMVEPVDPDPRVWQRIKGKVAEPAPSLSVVRAEAAPAARPVAPVGEPPRAVTAGPEAAPEAKADSTPEPKPEPEAKVEPEVRADALPTPDSEAVATAEQRLAELINEVEKFNQPTDSSEAAVALAEADTTSPEPAETTGESEQISREPALAAALLV